MAAWKLKGEMSCAKCKFLYFQDAGYSNYTVESTEVHCALDQNPHLRGVRHDLPYDWDYRQGDNWPVTRDSRCEHYAPTDNHVHFDVDGDTSIDDFNVGSEAIDAILKHAGKSR